MNLNLNLSRRSRRSKRDRQSSEASDTPGRVTPSATNEVQFAALQSPQGVELTQKAAPPSTIAAAATSNTPQGRSSRSSTSSTSSILPTVSAESISPSQNYYEASYSYPIPAQQSVENQQPRLSSGHHSVLSPDRMSQQQQHQQQNATPLIGNGNGRRRFRGRRSNLRQSSLLDTATPSPGRNSSNESNNNTNITAPTTVVSLGRGGVMVTGLDTTTAAAAAANNTAESSDAGTVVSLDASLPSIQSHLLLPPNDRNHNDIDEYDDDDDEDNGSVQELFRTQVENLNLLLTSPVPGFESGHNTSTEPYDEDDDLDEEMKGLRESQILLQNELSQVGFEYILEDLEGNGNGGNGNGGGNDGGDGHSDENLTMGDDYDGDTLQHSQYSQPPTPSYYNQQQIQSTSSTVLMRGELTGTTRTRTPRPSSTTALSTTTTTPRGLDMQLLTPRTQSTPQAMYASSPSLLPTPNNQVVVVASKEAEEEEEAVDQPPPPTLSSSVFQRFGFSKPSRNESHQPLLLEGGGRDGRRSSKRRRNRRRRSESHNRSLTAAAAASPPPTTTTTGVVGDNVTSSSFSSSIGQSSAISGESSSSSSVFRSLANLSDRNNNQSTTSTTQPQPDTSWASFSTTSSKASVSSSSRVLSTIRLLDQQVKTPETPEILKDTTKATTTTTKIPNEKASPPSSTTKVHPVTNSSFALSTRKWLEQTLLRTPETPEVLRQTSSHDSQQPQTTPASGPSWKAELDTNTNAHANTNTEGGFARLPSPIVFDDDDEEPNPYAVTYHQNPAEYQQLFATHKKLFPDDDDYNDEDMDLEGGQRSSSSAPAYRVNDGKGNANAGVEGKARMKKAAQDSEKNDRPNWFEEEYRRRSRKRHRLMNLCICLVGIAALVLGVILIVLLVREDDNDRIEVPTEIPSVAPTMLPTVTPAPTRSFQPSNAPTRTVQPSAPPSQTPTLGPSDPNFVRVMTIYSIIVDNGNLDAIPLSDYIQDLITSMDLLAVEVAEDLLAVEDLNAAPGNTRRHSRLRRLRTSVVTPTQVINVIEIDCPHQQQTSKKVDRCEEVTTAIGLEDTDSAFEEAFTKTLELAISMGRLQHHLENDANPESSVMILDDTYVPPSEFPTASPTKMPALLAFLIGISFDQGKTLLDSSSPQHRAYLWLSENTNLEDYSDEVIAQRYVLATFYYSTRGDGWFLKDDWLSDENECEWYNNAGNRRVCSPRRELQSLEINFNDLNGTLPPELGLLSDSLERIVLRGGPSSSITGSLPSELGYLTLLKVLSLRGNTVSGQIPSELGNWANINHFDVSDNRIGGPIPTEIGHFETLTYLHLGKNKLTGNLPTEIGNLQKSTKLDFADNMLSGPLPSEIGSLRRLQDFLGGENMFSSMPSELGRLTFCDTLSLYQNDIRGTIPSSLASLRRLRRLDLRNNALTGNIPSEIGKLNDLRDEIDFSFNRLSGAIPSELGQLRRLRLLKLENNRLSGEIPSELSKLDKLTTIRLASNDFVGTVPFEVCRVFNRTYPAFEGDCEEFDDHCPCCTSCCVDNGSCRCRHFGTPNEFLCYQQKK